MWKHLRVVERVSDLGSFSLPWQPLEWLWSIGGALQGGVCVSELDLLDDSLVWALVTVIPPYLHKSLQGKFPEETHLCMFWGSPTSFSPHFPYFHPDGPKDELKLIVLKHTNILQKA